MIDAAFNLGDAVEPNWRSMHMCLIPKGGATPPTGWSDLRGTVLVWDEGPSPDGCIAGDETPWAILNPTLPAGPGRWVNHTQAGTRLVHLPTTGNLACSGHTWTADGRLFVAAGNEKHGLFPYHEPPDPCILGSKHAYLFDARTSGPTNNSLWVRQNLPLATKRWYPALVLMTVWNSNNQLDTRIAVLGGNHEPPLANNYQVWRPPVWGSLVPQQGTWDRWGPNPTDLEFAGPPPSGSDFGVFPASHLMSDGQLVVTPFLGIVNPWPQTTRLLYTHSAQGLGVGTWTALTDPNASTRLRPRVWGCSVLMPNLDANHRNSVIQLGGSLTAAEVPTQDVQMCRPGRPNAVCWPNGFLWTDLPTASPPSCSVMASMRVARYAPNTVLLPDGSFLVLGGQGVMEIERYDGAAWRDCASLLFFPGSPPQPPGGFGFHSTAILLPSGKVLVGGGNRWDANHLRWDFQVYSPWYLVAGVPRPQISDVNLGNEQIQYNQLFRIKHEAVPGAAVSKVVLMRPGSVTHGFDSDQRYIELEIIPPVEEEVVDGEIMVRMPPRAPGDPGMLSTDVSGPPGFYMLFLVSAARVPSEAAWVELMK